MRSSLKSSLKVSLICLILIFSLTDVSLGHGDRNYSHDRGPRANNRGWMGALKNDLRLSDLTIPGTHETMSLFGTDYVKTQTMDLWSQLVSGIRVLDIRCAIVEMKKPPEPPPPGAFFNIYHGAIYQRANFDEVLRTVRVFLEQNRGETVLMRVKQERTNDSDRFEDVFRRGYWNKDEYKNLFWQGTSENPTLGEMRRKIVILQDFARWQCPERKPDAPLPHPDYGLCYNSLLDQDYFALNGNVDLYNKWEKVKKHLADANKDTPENNDKIYINYLSGSTNTKDPLALGRPFPYFVVSGHWNPATGADRLATPYPALQNEGRYRDFPRLHSAFFGAKWIYYEGTNTLVEGAILPPWYTRRVGIIMTDFPGGGLINRIICLNFPKENLCWKR